MLLDIGDVGLFGDRALAEIDRLDCGFLRLSSEFPPGPFSQQFFIGEASFYQFLFHVLCLGQSRSVCPAMERVHDEASNFHSTGLPVAGARPAECEAKATGQKNVVNQTPEFRVAFDPGAVPGPPDETGRQARERPIVAFRPRSRSPLLPEPLFDADKPIRGVRNH